jgi:hypothetical protein
VQSFSVYYENSKLQALKSFSQKDEVLSINDPKDVGHINKGLTQSTEFVYNYDKKRIKELTFHTNEMYKGIEEAYEMLANALPAPYILRSPLEYCWAIKFKDGVNIIIHGRPPVDDGYGDYLQQRLGNILFIEYPYDIDYDQIEAKLAKLGVDVRKLKHLEYEPPQA